MPQLATKPHDLRRKANRRLTAEDRLRLHRALTEAESPEAAARAFGCTPRALSYYAGLEGLTPILPAPRPSRHTMESLTAHERAGLVAAVHRGESISALGRRIGMTRQAAHLWLKRSGLLGAWRAKRALLADERRQRRYERIVEHPEAADILAAAHLLADEGMTVQCIPAIKPQRCLGAGTRLYANDRIVRFVEASPMGDGQRYLRFQAYDPAAIYVASVGDRWYIYAPPYPPGGVVYLHPERAIAHRRPEQEPALVVNRTAEGW